MGITNSSFSNQPDRIIQVHEWLMSNFQNLKTRIILKKLLQCEAALKVGQPHLHPLVC